MAGRFVFTCRVEPPKFRTLLVMAGGSFCFAGFSPWRGWTTSDELSIEPPAMWFLTDAMVAELAIQPEPETATFVPPRTRKGQLLLEFNLEKRAA